MNENITANTEAETVEETAAENSAEEMIDGETITEAEGESAAAQTAKPKSRMFILYVFAFVIFIAAAVTALVCFGIYANNLVNGESAAEAAIRAVQSLEINL